jgi:hypothetical protein
MKTLIETSIDKWLAHRAKDCIPWQLHIIAPYASMAEKVCSFTQEILKNKLCPINSLELSATYVISKISQITRKTHMKMFRMLKWDVIVTWGVLGRSADYPLLSSACNLRLFKNTPASRDSHTQVNLAPLSVNLTLGANRKNY